MKQRTERDVGKQKDHQRKTKQNNTTQPRRSLNQNTLRTSYEQSHLVSRKGLYIETRKRGLKEDDYTRTSRKPPMFRNRQTPADPWQRKNLLRFPRVAVTGRSQVRGWEV